MKRKNFSKGSYRYIFHYILLVLVFGGCATQSLRREITREYFFPFPPDPPRIQYLRSFNGSSDFEQGSPILDYLAGTEDAPQYEIAKPFSVAAWEGRIYVTDSFGLRGLNVFDLNTHSFYVLGAKPGPGRLKKPIHVFIDGEGYKYVSDRVRRQVIVYGPDDRWIKTYGDGRSFLPIACVSFGNKVFILDVDFDVSKDEETGEELKVRRDQILVLDKDSGKPLYRIGRHGRGKEGFSFASFMTVDRLGYLYVSDAFNYRVVKLDSKGRVYLAFGRHGDRPGDFAFMKGIAVDRRGLIYVVDAGFQLVQVFDAGGRPLFPFGGARVPVAPMNLPAGIWIDYTSLDHFRPYLSPDFDPEYLVLVTNQMSRSHRVALYAFGKKRGLTYPPEEEIITLEETKKQKPLWELPVKSL